MSSHLREKTRYRVAAVKPVKGVSIALAAVMMSLAIFAVVVPSAAGLRPAILFGWLAVLSGLVWRVGWSCLCSGRCLFGS